MDGQSSEPESSGGLADLASFLEDTPEQESTEQDEEANSVDEATGEADTVEATNDEQDIDPDAPDEGEEVDEPAPVATKITFKVKGEDGTEETVEATTDELASSYLRQKDYTRKTQALAAREDEAVKFFTQKHDEIRNQYLTQAETARAAVSQMAGLKTESEMAQLANTDPAAWVAENQRQRQITGFLNQLDQQINGEKQRASQEQTQRQQQVVKSMAEKAWTELAKDGIDKPKLTKIYGDASKNYGFSDEELGNVYDHRLVRMMRDATAYQALKAAKPAVTKQLAAAPRMPPSRQAQPANERKNIALENKFKSGRAKLNDLAAFLR